MSKTTASNFMAELRKIPDVRIIEHKSRGKGVAWWNWCRPYAWDVNVLAIHDTVTGGMNEADGVQFCMEGRSDLNGPLYNVVVSEKNIHLIGWGVANNAGATNSTRFELAHSSKAPRGKNLGHPAGGDDYRLTNSHTLAIALLTKVSETTRTEAGTAAAVAAAAGRAFGWTAGETAGSTLGHGELTKRKIDPVLGAIGGMGAFRELVFDAWVPGGQAAAATKSAPTIRRTDFVELRTHMSTFLSSKPRRPAIKAALAAADKVLAKFEKV